ncbi:hypothetical protein [Gemmata sp.]|uniref:hypothetical protein n=1 Tax=Gemmata sp. TaxID=1914242 RepID=UPI003F720A6E
MDPTPANPPASGLVPLAGPRPLFPEEIRARVADGARLVRFETVVSAVLFTVRWQSGVYLTHSWQERYLTGVWYSAASLLLGPWGVPWGLIYTPLALWVNLTGGIDATDEVLAWLDASEKADGPQG